MSPGSAIAVARAGALARASYAAGANCAESVLAAVPEALCDESLHLPEAIGMGWTAGIGEGGCLCGALAAGVMLVGAQSDSMPGAPAAKRRLSVDASGELREAFKNRFGSTCCRVLRHGMPPDTAECRAHCETVTGETAEMVAAYLVERALTPPPLSRRFAPRDLANAGLSALSVSAVAVAGFFSAVLTLGTTPSTGAITAFVLATLALSAAWALWRAVRA